MKREQPSFWQIQFVMALCAVAGLVFGTVTWAVQHYLTGGPSWLPYAVGLVVFMVDVVIVHLIHTYGWHD